MVGNGAGTGLELDLGAISKAVGIDLGDDLEAGPSLL